MQKPSQLIVNTVFLLIGGWGPAHASGLNPASQSQPLALGVQNWVAKQQGLAVQDVQMTPLDARVKPRTCDEELRYEYPFPSAETVKVSCKSPAWQLFVRVTLPVPNARPGLAQSSVAAVSAPSTARKVWVVSHHLSAGSPIQTSQVTRAERDAGLVGAQALDPNADIRYAEAIRDLPPGTILKQYDIRPQLLIKRGQLVQMVIGQSQGFQITARVEAMQDGRFGEQIKLKNAESGRILTGVVTGPGMVSGS